MVVKASTHNAPFETEQDFSNKQDFLGRCKENDEQEASHDYQGAEHDFPGTECRNEPSVDDSAQDGTATGTLAESRLPASGQRITTWCLLCHRYFVAIFALKRGVCIKIAQQAVMRLANVVSKFPQCSLGVIAFHDNTCGDEQTPDNGLLVNLDGLSGGHSLLLSRSVLCGN